MKYRALCSTLILGAALSCQSIQAQTIDPCTTYMCMAGISGFGASGGPGCAASLDFWHAAAPSGLAVWDEDGFHPHASAKLREAYLGICQGSNPDVIVPIMTAWGSIP